jgi:membrane associated rhomboid family serine protease
MIIPIRTDSRLRTTPYMNWLLIAANVIVFALQKPLHLVEMWTLYPQNAHWWNYITYAFLHHDIWHIGGNMLFLYIFGNNVNDKMGNLAYLGFYLAGAVFAGAGYNLTASAGVLGASGAVSAVTGAYLVLMPRSSILLAYFFYFIGTFEVPSMYLIVFFFAKDLLLGVLGLSQTAGGGVAYLAHVSGTLFGFVVCMVLLWVKLLPRDQFDILALLDRWNRRRQYRDVVASGYNPFGYSQNLSNKPAPAPSAMDQRISQIRMAIANALSSQEPERAAKLYLELKSIDIHQVLSRQAQLDVANQLAAQQEYLPAAEAYEQFIKAYPKFEQMEQVELMLGLIYARYLHQYPRAQQCLVRALAKLHGEREIEMAKGELTRIELLMAGLK